MKSGLNLIYPNRKDYSLVHTFGGSTAGLPDNFSIYDGRIIPDQDADGLPFACTAYATTFIAGLEDGTSYPIKDFYLATPPGDNGGRDIRTALSVAKNRGFLLPDGTIGAKKGDYYNCYGTGKIDDFDASRIGCWINQQEKRGVTVGSWFYPEFVVNFVQGSGGGTTHPAQNGIVPTPSFNTTQASLHNWTVTGWKTINGILYLEAESWQGNFLQYFSREIFNALMKQPYSGSFTLAKTPITGPVPVGLTAYYDHIVYVLVQFIRNLYHV